MKLKSILSLATLVFIASAADAQTSNLRRAKSSYNRFSDVKSVGNPYLGMADLKIAQRALEKAVEHEKTKDLAETWVYQGLVNADLALLDTVGEAEKFMDTAIQARLKAIELDKDGAQAETLKNLNTTMSQYALNEGVKAWEKKDFKKAYEAFDRGVEYVPNDTTLLYYGGLAAIQTQDYGKALEKYVALIPAEDYSNHRQIVLDASKIYLMQKDTVNAIKYADMGRNKYPEDKELATQYIELNLMAGNEETVIDAINEQAQREPENKTLQYYLGIAYNATKDIDKAEAAYRRAIEIDPNYIDAYINLGGLILNRGIDQWNALNSDRNLTDKQYNEQKKKVYEVFDQALPILEKAVSIDSTNRIALSNLQKYYQVYLNEEKVKEIQSQIDALN